MSALVLLFMVGSSVASFNIKCSDKNLDSVSVMEGDMSARYVVSYCTKWSPPPLRWELMVNTVRESQDNCSYERLQEARAGTSHSGSTEDIDPKLNITCPYVCFSKSMDLLFRSCYRLENKLTRQGDRRPINSEPFNWYFYADNNVTGFSEDTSQYFHCNDIDNLVICHWFEGQIPITEYEISMWPNATHNEDEPQVVSNNCTRIASGLQCALRVVPGCYELQLRHTAAWTRGHSGLAVHTATFCHTAGSPPTVPDRAAALLWWAAGGGTLALACALAALLAYHRRRQAKAKLRVWQDWITRKAEPLKASEGASGKVLLLYARDCTLATRVAAALRDLLQDAAPGQVWDVYSPHVTAAAAGAPAAWVRACLAAPDVRVLLLQTPALAAIHSAGKPQPSSILLEEPLLARPVVQRSPVFGDSLLQYAVQLLGETHTQPAAPYRKYFLATISALPVDVFPAVVPYTRFELPAAAPALLAALWPHAAAAPADDRLRDLTAAVADLVEYVQQNPNYLADELMFL